ncbi:MAG: hypothetical protein NUV47_00875 [Patescibacteria group bacterium]|nr:hypothetical protein [Patescibacteria group bacterium]
MQQISKNKTILSVVILVLILGLIGYFYVSSSGNNSDILLQVEETQNDQIVGKDLLMALNRLNAITLDDSLLKDSVFNSLNDFSVTIVPQAVGRDNPFSPL